MTSPRASVVVTNHDYARYVGAAIESALGQHGGAVEVIVVDDGSTDDSLGVIRGYSDRVVVVSQENGGQGSAFNAGFARVRSPIVFFLDADDLLAPDVVDRVEAAFGDPDIARVQFRLGLVNGAGEPMPGEMPPVGTVLASGDVRRALVRFPDDLVWQPTSGNAFRTDVLRRVMPMPTEPYRICADYYLSNLSPVHGSIAVLDRIGGSYRIHGANADYADAVSLEKVRANIVRTSITHRHLIDECERVGLEGLPTDPDEVRSVTALAMRIISKRFEPVRHPIGTDSRSSLAVAGVRAAVGRFDVSPIRRVGMAWWFVAMATIPAATVPMLARRFIDVDG